MTETATFASGCFWCTEAIFQRIKGVLSVMSGYTGGDLINPTYQQDSEGTTKHAEAIQITFDPQIISYEKLLEIFFHTHDPTTLNRQGNDMGTQYRSAIFYHSQIQKEQAEKIKNDLQKEFPDKIMTEIVPYTAFFKAEEYHQEYYNKNQQYPYCQYVIDPKLKKLLVLYTKDVKEEYLTTTK